GGGGNAAHVQLRHRLRRCRAVGAGRSGDRNPAPCRRGSVHHWPRRDTSATGRPGGGADLTAHAHQEPARLVVVLSGRGRNLEAIMRTIDSGRLHPRIVLVISNKPNASGLRLARTAGLPWATIEDKGFSDRADYDRALAARIANTRPDWVVLAGFMRILGAEFVNRFQGRLINIHPSLLPRHRGLHTHERALGAGDERHGASVHFVTDELDAGPVIRQGSVVVRTDDTPETLANRVLV